MCVLYFFASCPWGLYSLINSTCWWLTLQLTASNCSPQGYGSISLTEPVNCPTFNHGYGLCFTITSLPNYAHESHLSIVACTNWSYTCTNGHSLHMNDGRCHLCSRAAWNWNGMQNTPMKASARARLPMYKLITVCMRRPVAGRKKDFFFVLDKI